jgi:hypothetical protein
MAYTIKPAPANSIRFSELATWLRDHAVNPGSIPNYSKLLALRLSGHIRAEHAEDKRCRYVRLADLPKIAATLGVELRSDLDIPIAA